LFPWYDSHWLSAYWRTREFLAIRSPDVLRVFERATQPLHTRRDFEEFVSDWVDAAQLAEIREVVRSLRPDQLELHEARAFGRFVVHDHPYFTGLQERFRERVEAFAGEPLASRYNFLSLYGAGGVCAPHLDAPEAKWTLDLCIDCDPPWPISFSRVRPWPHPGEWGTDWAERITGDGSMGFREHTMRPGQAVVFSGSAQWHFRRRMPSERPDACCDLVFFHFTPTRSREWAAPRNWPRLLGFPELEEFLREETLGVASPPRRP
jgi:hypothetical protein